MSGVPHSEISPIAINELTSNPRPPRKWTPKAILGRLRTGGVKHMLRPSIQEGIEERQRLYDEMYEVKDLRLDRETFMFNGEPFDRTTCLVKWNNKIGWLRLQHLQPSTSPYYEGLFGAQDLTRAVKGFLGRGVGDLPPDDYVQRNDRHWIAGSLDRYIRLIIGNGKKEVLQDFIQKRDQADNYPNITVLGIHGSVGSDRERWDVNAGIGKTSRHLGTVQELVDSVIEQSRYLPNPGDRIENLFLLICNPRNQTVETKDPMVRIYYSLGNIPEAKPRPSEDVFGICFDGKTQQHTSLRTGTVVSREQIPNLIPKEREAL